MIMKKFLYFAGVVLTSTLLFAGCKDEPENPGTPEKPDVPGEITPDPVQKEQNPNTWVFNDGDEVAVGSMMIFESSGNVKVFVSGAEGLKTVPDFEEAPDCTEITFPVSAIGTDIDLTKLSKGSGTTYFLSRLPEFGDNADFLIDADSKPITEGVLSSSLESDDMTVKCEFTTASNIKYSLYLKGAYKKNNPDALSGSILDYTIASQGIYDTKLFQSGFYLKNTWSGGWIFSYSVSDLTSYMNIGNNTYVEIYVGADELLNGEPFDVATTEYPFSVKFEYLDIKAADLVPYYIDNDNREGASGTITFTQNSRGFYDVEFDVAMNNDDVIISGYYAEPLKPRNMIYNGAEGEYGIIRSATLDTSGNPVVLYLSTQPGTAGPEQYDIMGQVPAKEWVLGKFMAFSGNSSKITWTNGVCYDQSTSQTTNIFGGNWRVMQPVPLPDGDYLAECTAMLFGQKNYFAYYYGVLKIIE